MRKSLIFVSLALVASILLAGCGGASAPATTAPTNTAAATATAAPATVAPTNTSVATATSAPAASSGTSVVAVAPTSANLSGDLTLAGSTTVEPLAEALAAALMKANPGLRIAVQGGGSSVGVKSAGNGTVDIGTASRELTADEKSTYPDLQAFTIARDAIAIVANPGVKPVNLTKDQVRDIFSGKITNWKQVGGDDAAIVVVAREEGSGTRAAFEEMVMGKDAAIVNTAILQNSNGAVRTTVASTPNSIAFLSLGYLDKSVQPLSINGVLPSLETASNGTYPIVRPLLYLTKGEPKPLAKAFIDYTLSKEGQDLVEQQGYLRVH